ncbi:acetyl-CoA C-acyltransferase (plasmid) [Rhodococcus jostii RHA1]|jgi:acetyl-CoA acyltransferase|uniref:Acetyl-CoA C-acyltransferase n=1 Tax=Rhodococcus jostii (strain RHA1) TaxID=101510 RepID=Q0RW29_RHOJR|nr:thiolase family protein [Rhodococcus jostii]ABH00507.1 acetyl-CoA C-acyltransferase [Rhodococcus jostii RHA1]
MPEAVIIDAVRTPIGKRKGALADIHPEDLSAYVLRALVERAGVDPVVVDDVIWGCVSQLGEQSIQIGRSAVLAAGFPESVPGVTVNRACGSSQQSVDFAAALVRSGHDDVVIAGGVESMTRVPMGLGADLGRPYGTQLRARYAQDLGSGEFPDGEFHQGIGAERIARKAGLDRRRLDEYSARSHALAKEATDAGAFAGQLVRIPSLPGFTADEGIRPGTTPETLAGLKPAFTEDGLVHAGNSSQISDGASAVLVTTPERAAELGVTPIARYHTGAVSAANPLDMLSGPIPATHKVLKRSGLSIADIGVFEVNEAFAPVPLVWQAEFGVADELLNPLGGAIAVGHPMGASGTILLTRMLNHMRDKGIRYGLQTMCEASGTANATIVELLD